MYPAVKHHPAITRLRPSTGRARLTVIAASLFAGLALTGCGNQYRPVVSAINPVGPAGQPTKFASVVSIPSPGSPGLLTNVDFSGDTVLSTPQILTDPTYFVLNPAGQQGYVINSQGSLNTFSVANPAQLITSQVVQTTLPADSAPVSITAYLRPPAKSRPFSSRSAMGPP